MTAYRVRSAAAGDDNALHRHVIASLPSRFRLVDDQPDVVLASGAEPEGVLAALQRSPRALVVDRIGCMTPDLLDEVTHASGPTRIVPAPRFGPSASVAPGLFDVHRVDLAESTIVGKDLTEALVEQLALTRVVFGAVAGLRVLSRGSTHYALDATLTDGRLAHLLLNGVTAPGCAGEIELHAIGSTQHLTIEIDDGPFARPARIRLANADGERISSPIHQHAHRLTLARLHDALSTGEAALYSLDDLQADVATARAALS